MEGDERIESSSIECGGGVGRDSLYKHEGSPRSEDSKLHVLSH